MHSFRWLIRRLSLCAFITLAVQGGTFAETSTNQTSTATNAVTDLEIERAINQDLLRVRYIYALTLDLEGTATEIGLDRKELQEFLRLKFKNNFTGFELKEIIGKPEAFKGIDPKEWAYISVRIWTVGERSPVACYVELVINRMKGTGSGYRDETLTISSAKHLKDTRALKDILAEMMERAAIRLNRLQGKM